jgi:cellulose 1,4-beta-cellobiosidase
MGTCCNEMDVWEANSFSAAFTPHPCTVQGQTACQTTACGTENRYASVCDPDGCDFNSYRMGDTTFYGGGMTVDTTQPFTVVTQFVTDTGTASGSLSEIRRLYVQNGVVIQNSNTNIPGMTTYNSISTDYCNAEVTAFGSVPDFANKGGFAAMSEAMSTGMVLVLSLWDDYAVDMLWLDSDYPTNSSATAPGVARGSCPITSGVPATIEASDTNAQVIYSNIKFGDIGSTYSATGGGTTTVPPTTTTTTTSPPSATQTEYGQCGGIGYTGPTACAAGTTCEYNGEYYSQCLP